MKSRQKTLLTNAAIYASILLIAALNGVYWKKFVSGARTEIASLKTQLENLKKEKESNGTLLEKTNVTKANYEAETDRRRKELEGYGDFLRKLSDKPETIEELQKRIEAEGIDIKKAVFNPMSKGEGANYWTFNFQMELEGSYKSFKKLLFTLPRLAQIFRIQNFEVLSYDNARHNWEVRLQLETYFSGQG